MLRSPLRMSAVLGVAAWFLAAPAGAARVPAPAGPAGPPAPRGQEPPEDAPRPDEDRSGTEEKGESPPIPEIPRDELPPKTRPPPDPEESQVVLGTVYIDVEERVHREGGEVESPEFSVVEEYLAEYFRRAGYRVAAGPGDADWRVTGQADALFETALEFRERPIGFKFAADGRIRVVDGEGIEAEKLVISTFSRDGKDRERTLLDVRRQLAKKIHDRLFLEGEVFTRKEIVELLQSLLVDPLEAAEPLRGEEVVERLADIGLPAVPWLLEALTDTRTVLAEMEYPGLVDLDDLKVYHVADKALEEIFQKVSRMDLETTPHERFIITRGWENEWRRFCPPFRDSPHRDRDGGDGGETAEDGAGGPEEPASEAGDESGAAAESSSGGGPG